MSPETSPHDQRVTVDGRQLALRRLDKILYPEAGTTKAEVIDYYARVAGTLLPHLSGRPVTRLRWPDGTRRSAAGSIPSSIGFAVPATASFSGLPIVSCSVYVPGQTLIVAPEIDLSASIAPWIVA